MQAWQRTMIAASDWRTVCYEHFSMASAAERTLENFAALPVLLAWRAAKRQNKSMHFVTRELSYSPPRFLHFAFLATSFCFGVESRGQLAPVGLTPHATHEFDVVVAGGSTAAFAAALAAAENGARTALLEPTDWVGGQLTASGVPAIDEAWHTVPAPSTGRKELRVFEIARDPANITPSFLRMLKAIDSPGECWVSRFCFRPHSFLEMQLEPLERRAGDRLTVFRDTVVKQVELSDNGTRIRSLTAIKRKPRADVEANGYDRLLSQDVTDWYSPRASARFDKHVLNFVAKESGGTSPGTIFIDASEWGDVLALSGARYLQGVEEVDGGVIGDDTCGQAIVFCFVQQYHPAPVEEPRRAANATNLGFGEYRGRPDAWERIWTYRRIRGRGKPSPGDLCLQNWGYSLELQEGGNDFPFGYLFKSRAETAAERRDWRGGIDLKVLAAAEQRAFAWHEWFKGNAPPGTNPRQITLARGVLGTSHGLAKLPYLRDTRRSIGLDGFVLRFADLTGAPEKLTGQAFHDRVALGAYPADVHPLASCRLPEYVRSLPATLPFFIPFRALTHEQLDNLLVAGKTMAQSFPANSATRLHPIEWSTGTAAGVAAAYMAQTGKSSRDAYQSIHEVQALIRPFTPIEWTIAGQLHPAETKGENP